MTTRTPLARTYLASSVGVLGLLLSAGAVRAQDAPTVEPNTLGEVSVIAKDTAGLIERQPTATVNGIDKPLIETARSASFASGLTLERYGVETVDDLVAVSPGAFTASFYGVPGSVNLRGTLAEIYFRGFKRIENRGTYPTPLGATEQVEIVRGPPTAFNGPGKVGGFLNFVPKTARVEGRYIERPTGMARAMAGSYGRKNLSGELGLPANFGPVEGGVYLYGELEDSRSFYRGIEPRHQILEVSSDFTLPGGWSLAAGGMYEHAKGYVQTPGWNRLTQALIDHGTYTTGRDTDIKDADGNGRLTPNEIGAGGLLQGYFGFPPPPDKRFQLDSGVGTGKIGPRDVFIADRDFSTTETQTYYLDLGKRLSPNHVLKAQLFHDRLINRRFVSYGYPAAYDAWATEGRLTWNADYATADGMLALKSAIGVSIRHFSGGRRETISTAALDRRDILAGPSPTDVFDDPFSAEPGGIGLTWESDVRSKWTDRGAFAVLDLTLYRRLNLVMSGRLDDYDAFSRDVGTTASAADRAGRRDARGKGSYSLSASYKAPLGLMPYLTYAETAALEVGQTGELAPSLIANKSWLSSSDLREAGVKGQWLDGALLASVSAYRQTRTALNGINFAVVGHRAKGIELELRWIASKNWSFSFNGDRQKTMVKGPDNSFVFIPPKTAQTAGADGYGGGYAVFTVASLRPGDYEYSLIPRSVAALYATYTSNDLSWGRFGATAGVKYVSKTSGTVPGAVVYPRYALVDASAFVSHGSWTASLNVDNLFDKLYFTPMTDVYTNVSVLPGMGRQWRVALQRRF
jgi:iron complex outermembrane receptor protein